MSNPNALSLYGRSNASATLATACKIAIATGGSSASQNTVIGTATGYSEIYSQGTAGAWSASGSIGSPSGNGWLLEAATLSLVGQQIVAGTWTPKISLKCTIGTVTADIYIRAYKYNGGVYTPIGSWNTTGSGLTTALLVFSPTTSVLNAISFASGDLIYLDLWLHVTANTGDATNNINVAEGSTNGIANRMELDTPGYAVIPSTRVRTLVRTQVTKSVGLRVRVGGVTKVAGLRAIVRGITKVAGLRTLVRTAKSLSTPLRLRAYSGGATRSCGIRVPVIGQAVRTSSLIYVSTGGSDANPGTLNLPLLTLMHAHTIMLPGDTCYVLDGTCTFSGSFIISKSGTSDTTRMTFASYSRHGAKLVNKCAVNDDGSDATVQINADYVDFLGFDISGDGRIGIYNSGSVAGSGSPLGSHNRINHHFIHDLGLLLTSDHNVVGIDLSRYGSGIYNAISNETNFNILRNIGASHNSGSHGIYYGTAYGTIQNNIVSGVPGYGIRSFHFTHHMTVSNNLVFSCGDGSSDPAGGAGGGIYVSAGGTGWTAGVDEPHDFSVITNNIVRDCVGWGGILESANTFGNPNTQVVANNTFSNNLAYNNSGVHDNVELDSGATNTNGLYVDPLFVDYQPDGTGDYHVQTISPAINAGTSLGAPSTDFDGQVRPLGSAYDIGTYESAPALAIGIAGRGISFDGESWKLSPKLDERWRCQFTVLDYLGTQIFAYGQKVLVRDPVLGTLFTGFVGDVKQDKSNTYPTSMIEHAIDCIDNRHLADKRTSNRLYTEPTQAGKIVVDMMNDVLSAEGVQADYAVQNITSQTDWAHASLSNVDATDNVDDGDLELSSSSSVSESYLHQADWNGGGTFSHTVATSLNTVVINGQRRLWNDGIKTQQTLYGNGNPTDSISNATYILTCKANSETRSRLDFAGTWAGMTIDVDVHVQNDSAKWGFTYRTTTWNDNNDSYAYAVEFASNRLSLRKGTNGGSGPSSEIGHIAFSPTLGWTWYTLRVVVSGSSHTVYLISPHFAGGSVSFTVTDSSFTSAGYIALRNHNTTGSALSMAFDNFGVMSALSGTWTSASIPIGSIPVIAGSIISWDDSQSLGDGWDVTVRASKDGGSTFSNCSNGGPIPFVGTSGTGENIVIEAILSTPSAASAIPAIRNMTWTVSAGYQASGTWTTAPVGNDLLVDRTISSSFGTSSDAQAWAVISHSHEVVSVDSNGGHVWYDNAGTGSSTYSILLGSRTAADAELHVLFSFGATTSPNEFRPVLRFTNDNNNYVGVRILPGSSSVQFIKRVGGTSTSTVLGSATFTTNTFYHVRMRVVDTTYFIKYWTNGNSEPANWIFTGSDSGMPTAESGIGMIFVATGTALGTSVTVKGYTVTLYPDPSLDLTPIGRIGSSAVNWTQASNSNTSVAVATSLDGLTWRDVSSSPGISIPDIVVPPEPYSDAFGTDTSANYANLAPFAASDTFERRDQSGWGTASDGETYTTAGDTAHAVYSIVSNQGQLTGSTLDNIAYLGSHSITNVDEVVRVTTTTSASGNRMGIVGRYNSPLAFYALALRNGNALALQNIDSPIASIYFPWSANTAYWLRLRIEGTTLSGKAWAADGTTPEPTSWMLSVTNTSYTSGQVGLYGSPDSYTTVTVFDSYSANELANATSPADWRWNTDTACLVATGGEKAALLYIPFVVDDVDLLCDIDMSDAGGLVWRVQDENNYYALVIEDGLSSAGSPNTATLYKVTAGVYSQLTQASITFVRGLVYRVRVQMQTGAITVTWDGDALLSSTDSSPIASGQVGLYNDGGTTGSRYSAFWVAPLGQDVTNLRVYTQVTLATTVSSETPQVFDLTVAGYGPQIGAGTLIPSADYRHTFIDKNLDDAAKQSNYAWWIDQFLEMNFTDRIAWPAPWVLQSNSLGLPSDLEADSNLVVESAGDLYRNRQVLTGVTNMGDFSDPFVGDGSRTSFTLRYPVAPGTVPTVTLNGIGQKVELKGSIGAQWYYAVGDATIAQDTAGVTLLNTDDLEVDYTGTFSDTVTENNVAAQLALAAIEGGTGIVEAVLDVSSPGMIFDAATTYAQQLLIRYCVTDAAGRPTGRTITFKTYRNGLAVGQILPVHLPEHNLFNVQMLITAIDITVQQQPNQTQLYGYLCTATELPNVGSWAKLFASGLLK